MTTATTSSSTRLFQDFLGKIYHSRKLLQPNQLNQQPATAALPSVSGEKNNSDSDVVMILSFLLCATICSIVLNFLINCLLSCCSSAVSSHDSGTVANTSTPIADKGIKQKALKTFTVVKYSVDSKLPGQDTECLICLFEFAPGERVRVLPKCNHGFHVPCIDEWLESHSSCPKCRSCQIETCKKIAGCSEASPSGPSQETVVTVNVVVPPEPEGMLLPNYLPLTNVHI